MLEVCAKFENCDGLEESPPVRSFRESTMDIVRAAACAKFSTEINFDGICWRQLRRGATQMTVAGLVRCSRKTILGYIWRWGVTNTLKIVPIKIIYVFMFCVLIYYNVMLNLRWYIF
eukprot:825748_1